MHPNEQAFAPTVPGAFYEERLPTPEINPRFGEWYDMSDDERTELLIRCAADHSTPGGLCDYIVFQLEHIRFLSYTFSPRPSVCVQAGDSGVNIQGRTRDGLIETAVKLGIALLSDGRSVSISIKNKEYA